MRAKLLVLASSIAMLGWGTVLPYQYAYAANTRGWGALVAALASTLFSVGALVAAPFAGRLSDLSALLPDLAAGSRDFH